jgi:hypothetical protein
MRCEAQDSLTTKSVHHTTKVSFFVATIIMIMVLIFLVLLIDRFWHDFLTHSPFSFLKKASVFSQFSSLYDVQKHFTMYSGDKQKRRIMEGEGLLCRRYGIERALETTPNFYLSSLSPCPSVLG